MRKPGFLLLTTSLLVLSSTLYSQTWKTVSSPLIAGYSILDFAVDGNSAAIMSTGSFNNTILSGIDLYSMQTGQWRRISPPGFEATGGTGGHNDLNYDSKGNLWVARGVRGHSLLRYDGMQWQDLWVGDSLDTVRQFRQIAVHPKTGHLWLTARSTIREKQLSLNPPTWLVRGYEELFEYDGAVFRKVLHEDSYGRSNRRIAISPDGQNIWLLQILSGRLMKINAGSRALEASYPLRLVGIPDGSKADDAENCNMIAGADGRVWFSYSSLGITGPPFSLRGALTVFDPVAERWTVLDSNSGITSLAQSSDNNIWLVKNAKLHKLDVNSSSLNPVLDLFTVFSPKNQSQYPNASSILDDNGKLWFGSNSMGIAFSESVVSVRDEWSGGITVFPNPASPGNVVQLHLPSMPAETDTDVYLTNLLGQRRSLAAHQVNTGVFSVALPQELSKGSYFIEISDAQRCITVPLLIQE